MSRSESPFESAVPEATVRELQALYREAAHEEPALALDRRILDAARADLQAAPARRPQPWWRGWLPLTSALAVAAVGLSLTWRVMDQQERELREEMKPAAPAAADASPASAAPAAAPSSARPVLDAPQPQPQATAAPAAQVGATRESSPAVADSAAPATAPPAAPAAERQAAKLEASRPGSSRDAVAEAFAPPAANAVAGAAARAADPSADASSAQAWLQQIRDLRAAGRSAEAAQSLARFRARYPDIVLPDDLRDLR